MSFQKGNTFVFGETPAASKWDQLWRNDDALADGSGLDDGSITAPKLDFTTGIWWEELGRTTLGSASDTITVAPIAAKKYLRILIVAIPSGELNLRLRFNNDSGNNYSQQHSTDFGALVETGSLQGIDLEGGTGARFELITVDVVNIANQVKLAQVNTVHNAASNSAAAAPNNIRLLGKWANTSSQITRIDVVNNGTGDIASGSEVVVLGHD